MWIVIASISGAWNNPGISSVIRIRLITADPVFFTSRDAETCCCLNDLSVSVEYFLEMSASTTVKLLSSSLMVPSVFWVALGRTVYERSYVKSGSAVAMTFLSSLSHFPCGCTSSLTSLTSNNSSSLPFIRTWSLTKSTAKDERFSKMV